MKLEFNKPYIVWTDYGYEGWRPKLYETLEEALDDIQNYNYGPCVLTTLLKLTAGW